MNQTTSTEQMYLDAIAAVRGGLTVSQLSRAVGRDQSVATRMVQNLHRRKLVRRVFREGAGRTHIVLRKDQKAMSTYVNHNARQVAARAAAEATEQKWLAEEHARTSDPAFVAEMQRRRDVGKAEQARYDKMIHDAGHPPKSRWVAGSGDPGPGERITIGEALSRAVTDAQTPQEGE